MATEALARGRKLAALLAGAWRTLPPAGTASPADEIGDLEELLLEADAGALAWWRLRNTPCRRTAAGRYFREVYHALALATAQRERQIEQVLGQLHDAAIEPILIKGWTSASHYAELGLRPYGDIDLCVPPQQLAAAIEVLKKASIPAYLIDLHSGIPDLSDRTWEDLYRRSRKVLLGQTPVRVLAPEDHLRLVCLHLVRHGGFRLLFLCDVAAALESRPPDFDWDYCLSGKPNLTAWVLAIIGLAQQLLGARLNAPEIQHKVPEPPAWMSRTVLWRWGEGRQRRSIPYFLRHPREALQGLRYHGLNPLRVVYKMGFAPRRWLPVTLIQLAAILGQKLPRQVINIARRWRDRPQHAFVIHEVASGE